uniref:GTP diphosphokinase n=1 Tax=Oryza glumipatula TaxID=40148 RepID=A0A0D9ZUL3_9ORYZ
MEKETTNSWMKIATEEGILRGRVQANHRHHFTSGIRFEHTTTATSPPIHPSQWAPPLPPMATAATTSAAAIPTGGGGGRRQHPHPRRPGLRQRRLHRLPAQAAAAAAASSPSTSSSSSSPPAEGGGRLVAELVGAFNELTGRMGEGLATSSSSRLLFRALKLALPALRDGDGGRALARALAIAASLADLQMDAEVISAGILREALDAGAISMRDVKSEIGISTAHLLHESLRLKHAPSKLDVLDDESASALRKFCLSYYDIRAVILELALKLDMMRHLDCLPRYLQQIKSLEVLKIYAPLAHAVGAGNLSLELEDLSFRYLFPHSYDHIDQWLRNQETENKLLIDLYKKQLLQALKDDDELSQIVQDISIQGRYKSRFSTMKKLVKDGRKPEEVNDILALRVILEPRCDGSSLDWGPRACHRTHEIIQAMWKEVPGRTKDYVTRPKENGYQSLHVAIDVSEPGKMRPLMEIQIRTKEMHKFAVGGEASHSLYKGGLTDPGEAKRLKAIMLAAAELAAMRLRDLPASDQGDSNCTNRAFCQLDKNGDGRISIEELTEVMEDLGAGGKDAKELMHLLDANSDGSLSSDEFEAFQRQIELMRSLDDKDDRYRKILKEKLQTIDSAGLIQVYRKQLGDRTACYGYYLSAYCIQMAACSSCPNQKNRQQQQQMNLPKTAAAGASPSTGEGGRLTRLRSRLLGLETPAAEDVGRVGGPSRKKRKRVPPAAVEEAAAAGGGGVRRPPRVFPTYPTSGEASDVNHWIMEMERLSKIPHIYTARDVASTPDKLMIRKAARSVVAIETTYSDGKIIAVFSGIVVSWNETTRSATIVTCSEAVCDDGALIDPKPKVLVHLPNKTILDGQLLFFNDHYRIMLLEVVSDTPLQPANFGSTPKFGQDVFALSRDYESSMHARRGTVLWQEPPNHGDVVGMAIGAPPNPDILPISIVQTCIEMWTKFSRIAHPVLNMELRAFELIEVSHQEEIELDHNINDGFIVAVLVVYDAVRHATRSITYPLEFSDASERTLVLGGKDANELMHLLDANSNGSLSSDEFEAFQRQIWMCLSLATVDEFKHHRAPASPTPPSSRRRDAASASASTPARTPSFDRVRRSGGRSGRAWRSLEAPFSRFGLGAGGGCPFDALLREKFLVREVVTDGDLGYWLAAGEW